MRAELAGYRGRGRATACVLMCGLLSLVLGAGQARAAGVPLFHDVWNLPVDQVIWQPDASGANWTTINVKYNSPCPVPVVFQGGGVDGGPWQGQAGWYKQQGGGCAGSATGSGTLTVGNINLLQLCTTDPFGVSGTVCQDWQRNNLVDVPLTIETTQPLPDNGYYALVYDQNGVPHFVPANANGASSVQTGDYDGPSATRGDTVLIAADGITGGKATKKELLSSHSPCGRPLRRALGAEATWMQIGLDQATAGASTAGQRQEMAAAADRDAKLEPALGKCLSNEHYRGRISAGDFAKAQASVSDGSLPSNVAAALTRAGAKTGVLDLIRFGLRSAQPSDLTGRLSSSLKSHARAASLRAAANVLRH